MNEDVLVPFAVFGSLVAVVWVVRAYSARTARDVQETIRRAMDGGQQLTPDLIKALGAPRRQRGGDLRWGIIWLAIGLGFAGFGGAMGNFAEEALYAFLGISAFPVFIGLALIAIHYTLSGKSE